MSTGHRPTVVRLPLVVAAADARGALDVDAARAGDRGRRQAAVAAGLDLELDRLAILETAEAVRLDRRLVHEGDQNHLHNIAMQPQHADQYNSLISHTQEKGTVFARLCSAAVRYSI